MSLASLLPSLGIAPRKPYIYREAKDGKEVGYFLFDSTPEVKTIKTAWYADGPDTFQLSLKHIKAFIHNRNAWLDLLHKFPITHVIKDGNSIYLISKKPNESSTRDN